MFEFSITLTLNCEGEYRKNYAEHFDTSFGNYLPGVPAHLENFHVFLTQTGKSDLDITKWLSEDEYQELYRKTLAAAQEEG